VARPPFIQVTEEALRGTPNSKPETALAADNPPSGPPSNSRTSTVTPGTRDDVEFCGYSEAQQRRNRDATQPRHGFFLRMGTWFRRGCYFAALLNRNSRIEEDLIDQLFNSSEKRLARVLLLLANFGKEATAEPIIGSSVRKPLRKWSARRDRAWGFFMNKFRKLGYIEYNGKLEIRNSLLTVVLYDKPEIRKHDASNGPR
jgi:hypothetical protein